MLKKLKISVALGLGLAMSGWVAAPSSLAKTVDISGGNAVQKGLINSVNSQPNPIQEATQTMAFSGGCYVFWGRVYCLPRRRPGGPRRG